MSDLTYLAGAARMIRIARISSEPAIRQWALNRGKEYLSLAAEQVAQEVYVKNDDTGEVTVVGIPPLDCPIEAQVAIQAALDRKFGSGAWWFWDAREECGDWASSSEI